MNPIYLDFAATTPVDPRVAIAMQDYLLQTGTFGNASSTHIFGRKAYEAIEIAREKTAFLIGAEPNEIIWTSGATESINLAIKGAALLYQRKGKHIVTMKTEHRAGLDSCQYLEKEGFEVTYLNPLSNGLLNSEDLKKALRKDTILVSIMHVNNETGIIQDLNVISQLTSSLGILLHVDAVQSVGKLPINLKQMPIDLLSFSSHKIYGPKGIGALYVRKKPRVRVLPFIHGGGQEQGMRSGTLATHQIVGMGEACRLASLEREKDAKHVLMLRNLFLNALTSLWPVHVTSNLAFSVPHIINIRFQGLIAKALLNDLPFIAASTASACAGRDEGSYVLRAFGLKEEEVKSAVRFSLGRFTTIEEIEQAIKWIISYLQKKININELCT